MTRGILGIVSMGVVALAVAGGGAQASGELPLPGDDNQGFFVTVQPSATITSHISIAFDFDFHNCASGLQMVVDDWDVTEPEKPDAGGAIVAVDYGLSNGDSVQRLVVAPTENALLAGLRWVGTGHATCGPVTLPIYASGIARSVNGS
jgi:hypothetical protein